MVAVSTLAALASTGSAELRAPYFDAGRGDVYGAVYDAAGALAAPEIVAPQEDWLAGLPPGVELVRRGGVPLARGVAAIALREFRAGRAADPSAVDANYVRRPDAEVKFRRSFVPESSSPVNAGAKGPSHE